MCASLDPTLVVLTGPTATGKSALALALAERFDAEIVSADSRLVYRGLDVGTAKPTPGERARHPHHLIDVVDPDVPFSVADFQQAAEAALAAIAARGRAALLVGGSPHYVQAVVDRLPLPAVEPSPALRQELEELARREGAPALVRRLAARDPAAAAQVDRSNLRRLVRAIEVVELSGQPFSTLGRRRGEPRPALQLALTTERPALYARIDARVDAMLAAGWLDEVAGLLDRGLDPALPSLSATGYRELVAVVQGRLALAEAAQQIKYRTHAFARRQYTWLRRDARLEWYALGPDLTGVVLDRVQRYLRRRETDHGLREDARPRQ